VERLAELLSGFLTCCAGGERTSPANSSDVEDRRPFQAPGQAARPRYPVSGVAHWAAVAMLTYPQRAPPPEAPPELAPPGVVLPPPAPPAPPGLIGAAPGERGCVMLEPPWSGALSGRCSISQADRASAHAEVATSLVITFMVSSSFVVELPLSNHGARTRFFKGLTLRVEACDSPVHIRQDAC
jgi:hypothetical protein